MKSVSKSALLATIILSLPGCAAKQWAAKQYGTQYGNELPPAPQSAEPIYAPEYGATAPSGASQAGVGYMPPESYTPPPAYGQPSPNYAVSDTPVKVGAPYEMGGKTYTPEDNPMYDEVGYASWYGTERAGQPTANGETFNPAAITAAHRTLPIPSYVEVTRLDTGQTILVRVNDRGPFASDRVIDLSEGAARQLGISDQGMVGVRVRRVSPSESERAALREGRSAQPRMPTPADLLDMLNTQLAKLPRPAISPRQVAHRPASNGGAPAQTGGRFIVEGDGGEPVYGSSYGTSYDAQYGVTPPTSAPARQTSSGNGYVVQIAAFSSRQRADDLARRIGANVEVSPDGRVFRVRMGPFATPAEAQKALEMVKAKGYSGARIFSN